MISCRDAAELIPLHVGDDLPGEEASRLEDHLESCALCGAEYASFASAREALLGLRDELPSRGSLWEGVALGLGPVAGAPRAAAALTGAGRPRRQPRWAAWAGLAAAAALAILFLPDLLRPGAAANPAADTGASLSAGAPLVQPATDRELHDFLLRSAALTVPVESPAAEGEEDLPLTTPATARSARKVY